MITDQQYEQIEKLYDYEIPDYIEIISPNKIKIKTDQSFLRGTNDNWHIVLFTDIVRYYTYEVHSMSGLRTLGTISGDWRNIDELAEQCIEIFKLINPKEFKEDLS